MLEPVGDRRITPFLYISAFYLVANLRVSLILLFPKLPKRPGQDIQQRLCSHPAGCAEDQSQNYRYRGNTLYLQGPALQVSATMIVF